MKQGEKIREMTFVVKRQKIPGAQKRGYPGCNNLCAHIMGKKPHAQLCEAAQSVIIEVVEQENLTIQFHVL